VNVAKTLAEERKAVAAARATGRSVGLVPTMGALHAGHYSLIDASKGACDFTAVSIFVNPTQFGPGEDLDAYPRSLDADLAGCEARDVDLVFMPPVEEMYPRKPLTRVTVEQLPETLCGRSRPGHFAGVCTVVAKLLNIFQPDKAFFGQKDFQQSVIVRRMAADLDFGVEIVVCPTVREADGLAMSSRNAYLTGEQRKQAAALHASLKLAERVLREGKPASEAIAAVRGHLAEHAPNGEVDYVQIVDPETLADVETPEAPVVAALAVRLGRARLIDNLRVELGRAKA
jgi:pantoate--beta-alanine ligase